MKNVTTRNILGGFLGGVLGILAFHLLNWYGLPVGCLFGVVLGWYHEEIIWALSYSRLPGAFKNRLSRPQASLTYERAKQKIDAFNQWRAKPVVGHHIFFSLSIVTTALIILIPWCCLLTYAHFRGVSDNGMFFIGIVTIVMLVAALAINWVDDFNAFHWCKAGEYMYVYNAPLVFWLKSTLLATYISIATFLGLIVMIGAAVVAVVWSVLYSLPYAFCVAFRKTGHWMCLGLTLAVTSLVAWLAHPFMLNTAGLWLAALTAGVVSGTLSALTGRLLQKLQIDTDRNPRAVLDDVMEASMGSIGEFVEKSFAWVASFTGTPRTPKPVTGS